MGYYCMRLELAIPTPRSPLKWHHGITTIPTDTGDWSLFMAGGGGHPKKIEVHRVGIKKREREKPSVGIGWVRRDD